MTSFLFLAVKNETKLAKAVSRNLVKSFFEKNSSTNENGLQLPRSWENIF